jgi:hypothetical protein
MLTITAQSLAYKWATVWIVIVTGSAGPLSDGVRPTRRLQLPLTQHDAKVHIVTSGEKLMNRMVIGIAATCMGLALGGCQNSDNSGGAPPAPAASAPAPAPTPAPAMPSTSANPAPSQTAMSPAPSSSTQAQPAPSSTAH